MLAISKNKETENKIISLRERTSRFKRGKEQITQQATTGREIAGIRKAKIVTRASHK